MANFEKWEERYKKNWCTREQLKRLVALGILIVNKEAAIDEYKQITGEDYEP